MRNNNVNTILFILAIIGLYALVSVGVYALYALNTLNTHKCHEYQTVSKILEVKYRDANVLLSNGKVITVYQAKLRPGDPICVRWNKNE